MKTTDTVSGPSLYAPDDYTAECWAEHLLSERVHRPRSWRETLADALEAAAGKLCVWGFEAAEWVRR